MVCIISKRGGADSLQHLQGERVSLKEKESKTLSYWAMPSKALQHNLARAQKAGNNDQNGPAAKKPQPRLRAIVRFATTEEAQRAIRKKDRTYLGNTLISLRLLP